MEETKIKIRNLNWEDRERFTQLIEEIADSDEFAHIKECVVSSAVQSGDAEALESENTYSKIMPLATDILKIVRERCLPKLKPWLLSLTELSEEDFNRTMPFDADIKILNQILEQDAFTGFFSGASLLLKRIKESAKQYFAKLQK